MRILTFLMFKRLICCMFSFSYFWGILGESVDMMFKCTTYEKMTYIKMKTNEIYLFYSFYPFSDLYLF